ncbi:hypothetical protein T484DRAFT_1795640 [Baffinella frigidus]|nr:hypothetical protein T484DRAFT_1795640 [Cryptophyta sp. CCMP2293]
MCQPKPSCHLSVVCNLRGDVKINASSPSFWHSSRSSGPSRAGAPSPSAFASFPPAAGSPNLSSVTKLRSLVQSRRSKPGTTKHRYPFADLNEEDSIIAELSLASTPTAQRNTTATSKIRRALSNSSIVSGAGTTTAPTPFAPIASPTAAYTYVFPDDPKTLNPNPQTHCVFPDDADDVVVTDANFKAHHHRHGECLAHPSGCECEKVQRPTLGHSEAWKLLARRFKAAHGRSCTPSSSGTNAENAPLERHRSDRREGLLDAPTSSPQSAVPSRHHVPRQLRGLALPDRANAPRGEDLRESERREKARSRLPARSSTPAVLAAPTRVAQRLKLVGNDSRARSMPRYGGARDARDVLPTSRKRPSKKSSGVRSKVALSLI